MALAHGAWLTFAFLVATAILAVLSKRLGIAYPIVFVAGGAILGFIPNLEPIRLEPELVFLIVLPVFLHGAGWTTDWTQFRFNFRPIGLAAIGLVAFTTVCVALIAHAVIEGITWPAAFALGAIISPTDSIAAEAIAEKLSVPPRILTIISGESLVNDASALTIYRFAIAAALAGTFSAAGVVPEFFRVAIFGTLIGLIVATAIEMLLRQLSDRNLNDEVLVNVIILFAPFASYLPAEAVGVSGVLSTVACAVYLSRASGMVDPEERIVGYAVWEMLTYLLNAFVFLLLGLQLRTIVTEIGRASLGHLILYGVVISIAVIVLRFVWIFPATYVPRWISPGLRARDPAPPWTWPFVLSWAGMRGIVSLAAALALPLTAAGGTPFPARNEIIFVTFCVIFATLVVMGLTLPLVIRLLGLLGGRDMEQAEIEIRIRALENALDRMRELEPTFDSELQWEVQGRIVEEYRHRVDHLRGHLGDDHDPKVDTESALDHRLQNEALGAERRAIEQLRRGGEIPDEIFRNIQFDLDLAETRMRQA